MTDQDAKVLADDAVTAAYVFIGMGCKGATTSYSHFENRIIRIRISEVPEDEANLLSSDYEQA